MTDLDLRETARHRRRGSRMRRRGRLHGRVLRARARGEPMPARFTDFLTHMRQLPACREDTEGLLAMLREQEKSEPR